MQGKINEASIDQCIFSTVKNENPETVEKLLKLVETQLHIPEQEILKRVLHLQSQGKLVFKEANTLLPSSIKNYLFSNRVYWYWTTTLLALCSALLTFIIPENAYPAIYARYVLGTIFIWILPGYAFIKALFPSRIPISTSSTNLDFIERVALSIGMSIVLVILNGFILNYTPFGIRIHSATLSLLILTLFFASVGVIRGFRALVFDEAKPSGKREKMRNEFTSGC